MKATVEDFDVLKSIQPQQVVAYLQASGWREQNQIADRASIWIREINSEKQLQLLLPLDRELEDFPLRMSKVLQTLEIAEQRSQLEILSALTTPPADVIRIRLTYPDFRDGSIPIDDGVHFFDNAKNMIMAAACSTVEPKAYFNKIKPKQATKYLGKVRIGQTERGSYILTIISPINEIKESLLSQEPFEREVIKKLVQSLEFILRFSERGERPDNLENFSEIIQQGVSANLCKALVGMDKSGKGRGLEISLSWSSRLSAPANAPGKIIVPHKLMPLIADLGKKLKAYLYNKNFEARGQVIKLARKMDAEIGRITVLATVEQMQRSINIELADPEYQLATQAHKEGMKVVCYGDLIQYGGSFVLKNPRNFQIING